ncbi:MAG: hypothetical protein AB8H12_21595 [Lewinella sp.]
MKILLLTLLLSPLLINAQHSEEEVLEIFGVFRLTELINDNGLAFLTAQVTEGSFLTQSVPTKWSLLAWESLLRPSFTRLNSPEILLANHHALVFYLIT